MTADERLAQPTTAAIQHATCCGQATGAGAKAIEHNCKAEATPKPDDMRPPATACEEDDMPVGGRLIGPRLSMPSVAGGPERAFSPASCTRLVEWLVHVQAQVAASGPRRDEKATPNHRAPEA